MRIGNTPMKFAVALLMLTAILTGCSRVIPVGGATEAALCDAWQQSLPTRSHKDTAQTQAEIGRAYDIFEAACQRKVKK